MNHHLFTQIGEKNTAKTATVLFDGDIFAKIDLSPVKLPCKYYNLVFLAMETWINKEWDPREKVMLGAISNEFSMLIKLMETQLEKDVMEKIINESESLTPFTVKLDYNFTV